MTQILLVEDNQALIENISFELEMQGYEVVQSRDGQIAIDYLADEKNPLPDIIVSDIAMPNVDGYGLLDYVRRCDRLSHLPFIFLTALNTRQNLFAGKELGADDYMVKPFHPEHLVLAIENKLKRMNQMAHHAERKMDTARTELLLMLSHELRTPLTALVGGTELLESALLDVPDEGIQQMLNFLKLGTDRLTRLSNMALLLVQLDSGHMKDKFGDVAYPHEMAEMIADICFKIGREQKTRQKGVEIRYCLPEAPLFIITSIDYFEIMLGELLRNAVNYSPDSGRIEVLIENVNGFAEITVFDDGPGIPPAQQDKLFKRFTQINRQLHEQQGMGLGLSLVKSIAELHGGGCRLVSIPGRGSRVKLLLPEHILEKTGE